MSDIIKDSIAPLVQRILSDPLHFKPAKHPEVQSNKPSSYIKIGGKLSNNNDNTATLKEQSTITQKSKEDTMKPRPKSLADALKGYTKKRHDDEGIDKKAKKLRKLEQKKLKQAQLEENDDIGEDLEDLDQVEEDEEEQSEGEQIQLEDIDDDDDDASSSSDDDSNYTDAQADTSKLDLDSISPQPCEIVSKKVYEQFQKSDSEESSEKTSNEDDEKEDVSEDIGESDSEDDEDYDEEKAQVDEEDSESEEEEDMGTLKSDDEDETPEEDNSNTESTDSSPEPKQSSVETEEDLKKLKEESYAKVTGQLNPSVATPPTSPDSEDDNDSDESQSKKNPVNLDQFCKFGEVASDRGSNDSNRIVKNWPKEVRNMKPMGLLNHGVTCYTNAAVQAMVHIPSVQHYLTDILNNKYKSTISPRSVSHVFAETAARMLGADKGKKSGSKYINPKKLIQRLDDINCMMSEWQQEDSHEYFMSLLSRLQEDSTPKGHKLNESIIYDIFGGLLHQAVTCKSCGHISETQQEFYDLSLHLGGSKKQQQGQSSDQQLEEEDSTQRYSITKSIRDFFSPELIKHDKSEKTGYVCEHCKKRTNAVKISSIDRAPETLIVHLKRFRFNGNSSTKVKQGVSYPMFLNLTPYTTSGEDGAVYQLISVVVHAGRSVSSGHYIAHCLQPDGSWATYDDEYINKIPEKQALRDPSAYYMVYTRLTSKDKVNSQSSKTATPSKTPTPSKEKNGKRLRSESEDEDEESSEEEEEQQEREVTPPPKPTHKKIKHSQSPLKHSPSSSSSQSSKSQHSSPLKSFQNSKQSHKKIKGIKKLMKGSVVPSNNLKNITKSTKKYSKNSGNGKNLNKRFKRY